MSSANLTQIAGTRRHTESPSLWVAVLAGSVLLHLVALLLLRGVLAQRVPVEASAPIAIEFVSPETVQPPTHSPKAASPKVTSRASSRAPASVPATPLTAPDSTPVLSPVKSPPTPRSGRSPQTVTHSAAPSPPIPAPRAARPPRAPAPAQRPTPLPSQGTVPQPGTSPSPSPTAGASPAPRPLPSTTPEPSGPIVSGIPLPPLPDPSPTSVATTSPTLPAPSPSTVVPGTSDRGQGTGIQLVVDSVQPGNQGRDVVDPTTQTLAPRSFPGVVYPPSIGLNLGRPLTVKVQIDRQGRLKLENGKPKFIQVLNSPNPDYEQLAIDLLQQMQFPQIRQEGIPVEGLVIVTLRLQPML